MNQFRSRIIVFLFSIFLSAISFAQAGMTYSSGEASGHGQIRLMNTPFPGKEFFTPWPTDKKNFLKDTLNFMRDHQGESYNFITDNVGVQVNPYNHLISQITTIHYRNITTNSVGYTNFGGDIYLYLSSFWDFKSKLASTLVHEADHQRYRHHSCGSTADVDLNGPFGVTIMYLAKLVHNSAVVNQNQAERSAAVSLAASRITYNLCGNTTAQAVANRALYSNKFPVKYTPRPADTTVRSAGWRIFSGNQESLPENNMYVVLDQTGILRLYLTSGYEIWRSDNAPTNCSYGTCEAVFQGDGNWVIYGNGQALWSAQVNSWGSTIRFSSVTPYVQIVSTSETKIWSGTSNMIFAPAQLILGSNGISRSPQHILAYQSDGNLVLYNRNYQVLWASDTPYYNCSEANCLAVYQYDGNLVLYINGSPYWASNTSDPQALLFADQNGLRISR